MDGAELRRRRKAARLTQAEMGKRLGLHRDYVGLMERGQQPITERTALAITALTASADSTGSRRSRPLVTTDPMEQIVERALIAAGIRFVADRDGGTPHNLDFDLPDHGIAIEVKRMHSERTGEQMKRAANVIVAQGEVAVRFLAAAIETGRLPTI